MIFHILNRGVEKRKIFLNQKDYLRFTYNLIDFNNLNTVFSYFERRNLAMRKPKNEKKKIKKEVVDVLSWCLMPNHFHVLTYEKEEKGVSLFSKKITSGYTQYFNLENDRSGVLFQGRSKIISVQNNEHFLWAPFYIAANPLNLFQPDWKEEGIRDPKKAFDFLVSYKWSSFPDLMGENNFKEVINKNLFYKLYNLDEKNFKKDFLEWLSNYKGGC